MKKCKKHISKALFFLTGFVILSFIGTLILQTQEAKRHLFAEIPLCLQASIRQIVAHKAKDAYYAIQYECAPNQRKIGEYETRTTIRTDTVFEYQSKIVDPEEEIFQGLQTGFLETNQLHADSIQIVFDSLLQEKNIRIQSIIGITSSFYIKKNEWSGDTAAININYRAAFTNQGKYEKINYYAYTHYSLYTVWILMHKKAICVLFACSIVLGVILLWWHHKRKKEVKNGIARLKNGNYRIRSIELNVKEKTLIPEDTEKEVVLPPKLYSLLILFLEAEHHKVSKECIMQKFWTKSTSAYNSMTSAINRLNKSLKDVDCAYTIITSPKEECYILIAESIKTEQNSSASSLPPPASP